MFWKKSFTGGIHPDYHKELSSAKPIEKAAEPKTVAILLTQHTGVPCQPLVKVGDQVKVGQKIGDVDKPVSAPVHASVSGVVKAIEPRLCFTGAMIPSIIIESDGKNELHESVKPPTGDLVSIIREAGIVGMGGAAFPTAVKLSPPAGAKIDTLLINGAECEPYLTCDHRVMLEQTELLIEGIRAVAEHLKVQRVIIGIEDNKKEAIDKVKPQITSNKSQIISNIQIVKLETKYPQGGERQLIKAVTGREVPAGGLPFMVGVVVLNVGTCAQIAKTLKTGMPLIERVVTVTGKDLKEPKNLLVKIGTSFKELIEQCGGMREGEIRKVIAGGPMMGIAAASLEVPTVKGTSGILVMNDKEAGIPDDEPCIRCARCVDQCPQSLLPNFLADYAEKAQYDKCERLGAMDCIECGICSYVCPSKRHMVQLIKLAKAEISKMRAKK